MYFPDLSPYCYLAGRRLDDEPLLPGPPPAAQPPVLNVGWLDVEHPYPVGPLPEGFLDRLAAFGEAAHRVNQTRGMYLCGLCDPPALLDQAGSAEIRVVGDGCVYAAPDLIGHYVEAHGYCPPEAFIAAVLAGPAPGSAAWREALGLAPEEHLAAEERLADEDDFTNNS